MTGTGEARIFWTISCMELSNPPGVRSSISRAGACVRFASRAGLVLDQFQHPRQPAMGFRVAWIESNGLLEFFFSLAGQVLFEQLPATLQVKRRLCGSVSLLQADLIGVFNLQGELAE